MSELARRFAAHLREFVGDRRRAKRRSARLPVTICLLDLQINSKGLRRSQTLGGHTLDISATGVGLVVPDIRVGEHYLAGENHKLAISLELPDGPIEMLGFPVRYESLEQHKTETGYLIGVRIIQMSDKHRSQLMDYLDKLRRKF